MKLNSLHEWNLTPKEAAGLQRRLAPQIDAATPLPFRIPALVAGADVSHNRFASALFASVVVLRLPEFEIVERVCVKQEARFPYVPGLLSFREAPPVLAAFARLKRKPDLLVYDGLGVAQPRRFGIASHLGLWLGVPTIGCAKSLLCGEAGRLSSMPGSTAALRHNGELVGLAMRTKRNCNPIYVSVGHRIDLPSAAAWTMACMNGNRIPEPTRQAHLLANAARRGEVATSGGDENPIRRRPRAEPQLEWP